MASIVWDVFRLGLINVTSIASYEDYLLNHMQYLKQMRDYRSADYFIFSEDVDFTRMEDAVVDASYRVIGIHQGLEGYKQHTRFGKKSDFEWNMKWAESIQRSKGSLQYSSYRFRGRGWLW